MKHLAADNNSFNILEHNLVPEHTLLTEEEAAKVLSELGMTKDQLPKIRKSDAAIKVDKCRFDGNVTGFIAEGGGGVVASNSFFSGNRSNWSISSGSKDASDTKEGNVIEK